MKSHHCNLEDVKQYCGSVVVALRIQGVKSCLKVKQKCHTKVTWEIPV